MRQQNAETEVRRRRVFYIPGFDPVHPRRYRELYRKEGAEQAGISGYQLDLKPKQTKAPMAGMSPPSSTGCRSQRMSRC